MRQQVDISVISTFVTFLNLFPADASNFFLIWTAIYSEQVEMVTDFRNNERLRRKL